MYYYPYVSSGILHYDYEEAKVILEIDQDIVEYYRSFIPKSIRYNIPLYAAHISIVRKESPPKLRYWGLYEGEEIPFLYSNILREDDFYFWIDVAPNERLKQIRNELGLSNCRAISGKYHITICNKKNLNYF
jgi:hypothetical protein